MKSCYFVLLLLAVVSGTHVEDATGAPAGSEVRHSTRPQAPAGVTSSVTQLFGIMANATATSKVCLDWNKLADFFLDIVRKEISKSGREVISIPDIDREFSKRIAFVNLKGRLTATGGWFSNLSTLQRTGNVTLTVNGGQMFTIRCAVGLRAVMFGFQRYEVKLKRLGPKGRIWGSVGSNSLVLTVKMDTSEDTCKAVLQQLEVVELNDLRLMVTGFGVLNGVVSRLANESIQKYKSKIVKEIEDILAVEVRKELDKTQCSEYFGYLLKSAKLF